MSDKLINNELQEIKELLRKFFKASNTKEFIEIQKELKKYI